VNETSALVLTIRRKRPDESVDVTGERDGRSKEFEL